MDQFPLGKFTKTGKLYGKNLPNHLIISAVPKVEVRSLFWGEAEAKKFLEQHGVRAQTLLVAST